MMTNLFSIFDPTTTLNFSFNWMSTIISMTLIPLSYWFIPTKMSMIWVNILNILHKEMKILMGMKFYKGSTIMLISLFSFILFNNFMGLFSYIFTSTSHLTMTLTLALPLWLSFMLFGWINNTQHMFIHLVPQSTPTLLMSFMVCIETISNIIRPLTLAVRLTANMIAGHLLLTLLSSTNKSLSINFIYLLIMAQFLLLLLETAVSIIQSYVFTILSTLYSSETI
uniref:ATP synthase subunit a n=1 Tax=Rhyzodiastes puetzi TaxID=2983424 RepID=A0A977TJ41_9CARA|nr:ATP synthase F0 subunit 6 [Rhyzodiastes puetzi]UXW64216.1 ATP synthase F0 subunit 6 [Rhyzodiastes puetzi]